MTDNTNGPVGLQAEWDRQLANAQNLADCPDEFTEQTIADAIERLKHQNGRFLVQKLEAFPLQRLNAFCTDDQAFAKFAAEKLGIGGRILDTETGRIWTLNYPEWRAPIEELDVLKFENFTTCPVCHGRGRYFFDEDAPCVPCSCGAEVAPMADENPFDGFDENGGGAC